MRLATLCLALVATGCHARDDGPARTVNGVVVDANGGARLAGVTVCGFDDATEPDCAASDAAGAYVVVIPDAADVLVSYRASGYVSSLVQYHPTGADSYLPIQSLLAPAAFASLASSLGTTIDATRPMLIVEIATRTPGTMVVPSGGAPGDGPFYYDLAGNPGSGGATVFAAWFNATPGTYDLVVRDQIGVCAPGRLAWPGATPTTVRARVLDGTATRLVIDCRT